MASSTSDHRVYNVSVWRYLVMWWCLGPFLALGVGLAFSDPKIRGAGYLIIGIMAPFLAAWHWLMRCARLEISAHGVRQREVGGGIDVAWGDIADMRLDRRQEGFITARPMESKGAYRLARVAPTMTLYDRESRDWIAERRFVPIYPFAYLLRRGDLRAEIAAHAPHLKSALDRLDAPPAPRPPLSQDQRRKGWIFAAVMLGCMAIAIVLIIGGDLWISWFFSVLLSVFYPLSAAIGAFYAWQHLKNKKWVWAVLSLLLAFFMACWSLLAWGDLHRLMTRTAHHSKSQAQ